MDSATIAARLRALANEIDGPQPIVGGGGGGQQQPTTPPVVSTGPAAGGFDKTIRVEWDWSKGGLSIDTNDRKYGGIGPNGLLAVSFIVPADANTGQGNVSLTAYPGTINACERRCGISEAEGDFSREFPWTRTGNDTGIQFLVGQSNPRLLPTLERGKRYYINIESPGCANAGPACDFILTCSIP